MYPRKQRRDRKTTCTRWRANSLRNHAVGWYRSPSWAQCEQLEWPQLAFFCIFSLCAMTGEKHVTCQGAYGIETAEEEHIFYRGDLPCDTSHLAAPPADSIRRHLSLLRRTLVQLIQPRRHRCQSLPAVVWAQNYSAEVVSANLWSVVFHLEEDFSQITLSEICIWLYWSAHTARSAFPFSSSGERQLRELHTVIKILKYTPTSPLPQSH